jgi:integrase/recombinase XerD
MLLRLQTGCRWRTLRIVQTLLRHANLNTTAIYAQVSDPKRAVAIDRLDPFG